MLLCYLPSREATSVKSTICQSVNFLSEKCQSLLKSTSSGCTAHHTPANSFVDVQLKNEGTATPWPTRFVRTSRSESQTRLNFARQAPKLSWLVENHATLVDFFPKNNSAVS